jgi:flagellar biogenesis protein FliO
MLELVPSVSFERVAASWWGFAEADRMLLGLIVIVLAALAAVYTLMRLLRTRGERRSGSATHARRA